MAKTVLERADVSRIGGVPLAPGIALLLVLVSGAIGLEPVWRWLHGNWSNIYSNYSHGYLTALLSLWMGYSYWRNDPPGRLAPAWHGAVPLAVLVGLLTIMGLVFIDGSRALLLPPILLSCVWLLFGAPAARRLLLPALFLYFAILPFNRIFTAPLQSLAIAAVGGAISISGFSAYIDEKFVHIPSGVFEIARGCSGTNYFVSGLTLASFFALMYLRDTRYRLLLVGIAALVVIFANWVRIYSLILIGHFTEMQHRLVEDHNTYGWVVFLVLFSLVILLARWLERRELAVGKTRLSEVSGGGENDHEKSSSFSHKCLRPRLTGLSVSWIWAGAIGSMLLLVPALVGWGGSASSLPTGLRWPIYYNTDAYEVDHFPSSWSPITLQAIEQRLVVVQSKAEVPVEVYRALYPAQNWGAELFIRGNTVTGQGWRRITSRSHETTIAGQALRVEENQGELAGQRRLIWSWYYVAGTPVIRREHARIVQLKGLLAGRRDAAVLAVSAVCNWDCDQARIVLQRYMEEGGAELLVDPASRIVEY